MPDPANPSAPLVFLSAGEASGEHYAVALMQAMQAARPGLRFCGLGSARMAALGFKAVVRSEDVAHMGITEVVRHAPYIYKQFHRLKRAIAAEPPALAVLIDFPDVNLRLAEHLHRHKVPVVYFVSPQLWAWKKRRIRRVQRYVDRMLVIFPFEEQFYRERGVAAEFVGHPLADQPAPTVSREAFARHYGLDASKPWIALLPGSRRREAALNLPTMLEAMTVLGNAYEYVLPLAPGLDSTPIERMIAAHLDRTRQPEDAAQISPVLVDDARAALHHARASVVASGTATVEAALQGNPFVVVYRLSRLSYAIARRVVTVAHVAMANLIAGRRLVPELIQADFTAAQVALSLRPLLEDGPVRAAAIGGLREVRERLAVKYPGKQHGLSAETAIGRVARICLELIAPKSQPAPSNGTERPPRSMETAITHPA